MAGVHALHRTSCDIVENKKRWKSNVVLILLNPDFLFYFFVKPFSFPLSFAAFFTSSAPYTSASMILMRSANAAPPQALFARRNTALAPRVATRLFKPTAEDSIALSTPIISCCLTLPLAAMCAPHSAAGSSRGGASGCIHDAYPSE